MATMEELEHMFDDHPSLNASLQDFEPHGSGSELGSHSPPPHPSPPPIRNGGGGGGGGVEGLYPSHHSGFQSSDNISDSEHDEDHHNHRRRAAAAAATTAPSSGGYSPPAWRRNRGNGARSSGFWRRPDDGRRAAAAAAAAVLAGRSGSRGASREGSPDYESADDGGGGADALLEAASRIRLPTGSLSPEKRRSPSPGPFPSAGGDFAPIFGGAGGVPKKEGSPTAAPAAVAPAAPGVPEIVENSNNYIRFAMRAEVQHRTEPFEAFFTLARQRIESATKSWTSIGSTVLALFFSVLLLRTLFQPATPPPVPDLVKVAGLAKAFEPLIFYSENGYTQVEDLQATGVAVWDLGESVRSANMTSAPIIVQGLDGLSESLKTLSVELTRFFANVDGDVDGILIVMDWARRELSHISSVPASPLSSLYANIHGSLSGLGLLEDRATGRPTALGQVATSLFGASGPQRTRATLRRTFGEFLGVLEEAIESELAHSAVLFALHESIDRQFRNLGRSVARETDAQERQESELLASLWTRVLGGNAALVRKFERNRQLLRDVRARTVRNKRVLLDHSGRLVQLKASLEALRRKLVSPLVRADNGSTLSVEEQIRGLDGTYDYLWRVRESQKTKLLESLYGPGRRRIAIGREDEAIGIEDGD